MPETDTEPGYWAIVELFGHRQLAGRVTEVERYGTAMMRIDVPEVDGQPGATHFYGGSAIYGEHPVDEETARLAAKRFRATPVVPAALPAAPSYVDSSGDGADPGDEGDDSDEMEEPE